jgi:hypothetical protein
MLVVKLMQGCRRISYLSTKINYLREIKTIVNAVHNKKPHGLYISHCIVTVVVCGRLRARHVAQMWGRNKCLQKFGGETFLKVTI